METVILGSLVLPGRSVMGSEDEGGEEPAAARVRRMGQISREPSHPPLQSPEGLEETEDREVS